MRIESHRGQTITVLDDNDVGSGGPPPQGYVVGRFGSGWAAFDVDGDQVVTVTGAKPLDTAEAALAFHRAQIDRWEQYEIRQQVEDRQIPVPAGPLPNPFAEPEHPIYGHNATLAIRAHVLADAFNALPDGSAAKAALLKDIKSGDAGVVAGFVTTPVGTLRFDEVRYSLGLWRRKQIRRAESALKKLQEAADEVLMTNDFLDLEARAAEHPRIEGTALAPLPGPPKAVFDKASRAFTNALASAANVQRRLATGGEPAPIEEGARPAADAGNGT